MRRIIKFDLLKKSIKNIENVVFKSKKNHGINSIKGFKNLKIYQKIILLSISITFVLGASNIMSSNGLFKIVKMFENYKELTLTGDKLNKNLYCK